MNSEHKSSRRMRYTRQSIVSNTFYQMPRFLTAGEFSGNKISNNARFLYTLLLDRHKLSVKNDWFDENGEIYIYFRREEMEKQLGLSDKTVAKVVQELKDFLLVEEKKQGLNKPNKIYLLSPIIGDDETPTPYLDPDSEYNPKISDEDNYNSELGINTVSEAENVRVRTRNNSDTAHGETPLSCIGDITVQDTEELRPNYNKLNNTKKKNNNLSDNEGNKTAATDGNAETQIDSPLTVTAVAERNRRHIVGIFKSSVVI